MNLLSIVELLSDGEFHSGSDLGRRLGVSRTAVWKALSQIEAEFGLCLESVKGKGYRLPCSLELLSLEKIQASLRPEIASRLSTHLFTSVDSTNSVASSLAFEESAPFTMVAAERQTAGRGRRGRVWQSPFAQNIYMSLGFRLEGGPERLAGLSLVAGLSVVRALSECSDADFKVKWPNDILLGDKKVAGLLVELQGEVSSEWRVVLGLGLNFDMQDQDAHGIDQPWAAVAPYVSVGRNILLARLVDSIVEDISLFQEWGFSSFLERWESADYFKGKEVNVLGTATSGFAEGVDAQGNLLLRAGDVVQAVNAGEVSVRASLSRD